MERTVAYSAGTGNRTAVGRDDRVSALFQPDTLLSAQYFDTLRRKTLLEAERRLMFAVLNDAIACYQENLLSRRKKNRRLFDEAEEWIVKPVGDRVFCFNNVCETLGFDPEYVRCGLLKWKDQQTRVDSSSVAWKGKKLAGRFRAKIHANGQVTMGTKKRRHGNEFMGINLSG
jgi:hypothetical protein